MLNVAPNVAPNGDGKISQNFPPFPAAEKSSQLDAASLNERRRAAIELLAMGRSFKAAAKELQVDRRTIFNWRKDELFQSELARRHQELWGEVSNRRRLLVDPSVEVLAEHLEDNYDRSRFRAATTILRTVKLRCSTGERSRDAE